MEQIRSIVVPTDFSDLARAATARAANLAKLEGASLHLVHALAFPAITAPYGVSLPPSVWEDIEKAGRDRLEEMRREAEQWSGQSVTAEIATGRDPVAVISAAVETHQADLVVMGSHGHRGLERAFLGSAAERTLRGLDTPVLVVKEDLETAARPIAKLLVAVDFSAHSDHAVDTALALARRLSAAVELLHVFDFARDYNPYLSTLGTDIHQKLEADARQRLQAVRDRVRDASVPVETLLRSGDASSLIASTAEERGCQLIVMGTRGLRGLQHVLLGSVAERTVRTAHCSVLAVKASSASG